MRDYVLTSSSREAIDAAAGIIGTQHADIAGPRLLSDELSPAVLDGAGEEVTAAVFGPATFRLDVRWHGEGNLPQLPAGVMVTEGQNGFARPAAAPPAPTQTLAVAGIEEVRAETLRRLINGFGARDQAHLAIKVQDAVIRAGVLTDKRVSGATLTAAEEAEAALLRQAQKIYLALKANGNRLEALAAAGQLPADFRDEVHWKPNA